MTLRLDLHLRELDLELYPYLGLMMSTFGQRMQRMFVDVDMLQRMFVDVVDMFAT